MRYLAIKNFQQFQHYRDRNPPWIKLYTALLDDFDFLALSDVNQRHLIMLWLLASRTGNRLPDNPKTLAQAIKAKGRVDTKALLASGFLVYHDASTAIATLEHDESDLQDGSLQTSSSHARPRARGEAEAELETESESSPPPPSQLARLHEMMPGEYRSDLDALLARVADQRAWVVELLALHDGMRGHLVSMNVLGQTIRDFNANGADASIRLFRGYVRDMEKSPDSRGAPRQPSRFPMTAAERQRQIIEGARR